MLTLVFDRFVSEAMVNRSLDLGLIAKETTVFYQGRTVTKFQLGHKAKFAPPGPPQGANFFPIPDCCVFLPALGCCTYLKARWNTFLLFSTCFFFKKWVYTWTLVDSIRGYPNVIFFHLFLDFFGLFHVFVWKFTKKYKNLQIRLKMVEKNILTTF